MRNLHLSRVCQFSGTFLSELWQEIDGLCWFSPPPGVAAEGAVAQVGWIRERKSIPNEASSGLSGGNYTVCLKSKPRCVPVAACNGCAVAQGTQARELAINTSSFFTRQNHVKQVVAEKEDENPRQSGQKRRSKSRDLRWLHTTRPPAVLLTPGLLLLSPRNILRSPDRQQLLFQKQNHKKGPVCV
ncbi:unnamed protein product [Pleuronectes platessa]|uniref:Uncharacterized protein n=1 Tax=Pleuronectes platessa TaxID=8262 RepID=A0A9N7VDG5_PLEPL|nr:unnamed protein product [Pleuronectes platessa]